MATTYKYTVKDNGDGKTAYVKYNVSPSAGKHLKIGDMIKITGQLYWKTWKTSELTVKFYYRIDDIVGDVDLGVIEEFSTPVEKATAATFTINLPVTETIWKKIQKSAKTLRDLEDYPVLTILGFDFDLLSTEEEGYWSEYCVDNSPPDLWTFRVEPPKLTFTTHDFLADADAVNSFNVYDAYAQNWGKLSYHAEFAPYHSDYSEKFSVRHTMTLTGAVSEEYGETHVCDTTSVTFDLPNDVPGTIQYTYTATDTYGNSVTYTGQYVVAAYSVPSLDVQFERYAIVPTSSGNVHEASDDGEYIWMVMDASVSPVSDKNAWAMTLTAWRDGRDPITPEEGKGLWEDTDNEVNTLSGWTLVGTDGTTISIDRTESEAQLAGMLLSAAESWHIRVALKDALGNEVVRISDEIEKAAAVFDVEPTGVAVGKRSAGTESNPLFEVAYPAKLYAPVDMSGGVVADTLFKLIDVEGGITIAKGGGSGGEDLTSAEWTAALAAGYVPVAIAAVYSGSSYWPLYQAAIKQDLSGIHISIRRFDGTVSSATTITATARVLFVKMSS